jgi:hypothetical protein
MHTNGNSCDELHSVNNEYVHYHAHSTMLPEPIPSQKNPFTVSHLTRRQWVSLDPVHGRSSGRHKAMGPRYVLQQQIHSATSCWLRIRGARPTWGSKGVNANHFLIPIYRWHTGLASLAEAAERTPQRVTEKSTLSVVQVVKVCILKWSRRQSRGLVRKNPVKKVLTSAVFKMAARYRPIF